MRTATRIARDAVTQYGMSDLLGPRTFGSREELIYVGQGTADKDYSDKTAEIIDAEVGRLVKEAAETATRLLSKHRAILDKITEELLVKETLEEADFVKLVGVPKGGG